MLPAGAEVTMLSALPAPSMNPIHRNSTPPDSYHGRGLSEGDLPRSASFTSLSAGQDLHQDGLKRTFSDQFLNLAPSGHENEQAPYVPNKELFRRLSRGAQGKIAVTGFTLSSDDLEKLARAETNTKGELKFPEKGRPEATRSVSSRIRTLARRSWRQSSRSPSPAPKELAKRASGHTTPLRSVTAVEITPAEFSARVTNGLEKEQEQKPGHARRPSLSRRLSRPLSVILPSKSESANLGLRQSPSLQSLRSRRSTEKLPHTPSHIPPVPSSLSTERLSSMIYDPSKKKDPLWSVFRALEGDFQKFHSKSTTLKANVIRTSLLPFLTKHADHPSNGSLRSEDLDRRVMILNKWWIGLLELLNGRNNQSISGTDRPVYLEGVLGVMARPEWRIPSNPRLPESPLCLRQGLKSSPSTSSLESGGSDFLTESVHHNVRNLFIQNLLSQMAFVVDRMSARSAPASLVNFCGRATAYAFFFCPGVADILVRLWNLSADGLRRVLNELGVPRGTKIGDKSVEIAAHFPPAIRSLSVNSHATFVRYLHHKMPLPLGAAFIRWYGPWVGRWKGRDSDLFFSFAKAYHLLAVETYPQALDKETRASVPGLVPVHAQLLAVLEATLYRQSNQSQPESYASNSMDEVDSSEFPLALSHTTANATRSITENRLVILLRDLLADTSSEQQRLRFLYADSFADILKAATKKLSVFDSDACFVLCDLMEEVLSITSRFNRSHPETPVLDWPFWLQAFKKMTLNQNTLTSIRLIAFLYSTWNILIANPDRRRELCLDWLLEPSFFQTYFHHWCPMVRAYYLRLLCWRIARFDGEACALDILIYQTLLERLKGVWANYLYLKKEAEDCDQTVPSSAPCSPAPSRRLVIIRNDAQPLPTTFTSFDNMISQMATGESSSLPTLAASALKENPRNNAKKRWSIMKNIMSFGTPGNTRPGEVTPPASPDSTLSPGLPNGVEESTSPSTPANDLPTISNVPNFTPRSSSLPANPAGSRSASPSHQPFLFKFSLEWNDRHQMQSRNRILSPPTLPAQTQALMNQRLSDQNAAPAEVKPTKPRPADFASAKYSGRALAEWAQVVGEFASFFERRKDEGVPRDRSVETPSLGVETFRMFG